jgi:RNA polymerase sigma-70 factor (ECF subfamily)
MNDNVIDFQKIYTDFRPKIHRYLTRLVGEFEAEDLTQEVFLRISQALHTFRGESKLSTWIYRIATNAALDRMRAPSFNRTVQNGLLNGDDSNELEVEGECMEMGDPPPSPEKRLFLKERYQCYQDRIEKLPVNYRTVVALSELEELAASEIAEILGLSLEVVKIRLHRGRTKLLKELKTHCKVEDWL